jgi:hypothetical protein
VSDIATHRTMDHSPFLWMSKAAQDRVLQAAGSTGLAIYAGLCRLESDAPPKAKDAFHASAANISRAAGVGTRTVERHLPLLARAGLIVMRSGRRSAANGANEANTYRLLNIGHPTATATGASVFESGFNGGQKRNSSRRGERISSEGKENAAGGGAATGKAGSASQRRKKASAVSPEAF